MLAKLAQEIVNITSEVIVHDVLIADKDGMVLGSRDVGKFLLGGTPHAHQAKR
ncbi:sugar diacid recognition domain-containing protein, partial [Peribacillus frigoritolerans]|uniref:sugar diacid recognition domain-containing protein n=1 Tax=Peribacillus frigoritolerans TaxID=450367 RepID=UPI00345CC340